jgi:replicative DNA helicase
VTDWGSIDTLTPEEVDEKAAAVDRAMFTEPHSLLAPVNESLLRKLRHDQTKPIDAVPTSFPTWNRMCRSMGGGQGLARSWNVVVGGSTGAGKSLLALCMAKEALAAGENVVYFSLEMDHNELLTRLRPMVSSTDIRFLEWGSMFDTQKAEDADREILALPGTLYVNTAPIYRLEDIGEVIETYFVADNCRYFILDYMQLVEPSGVRQKMREAIAHISHTVNYHAKNLGFVHVGLSQYNRRTTQDRDHRPTVDSLIESSALGNDANQVLLLDHSRREENPINRSEKTYLLVAKNRHGPCGEIPIRLDKATLRFDEIYPDEESSYAA